VHIITFVTSSFGGVIDVTSFGLLSRTAPKAASVTFFSLASFPHSSGKSRLAAIGSALLFRAIMAIPGLWSPSRKQTLTVRWPERAKHTF
jgi:hypothetical protein